MNISWYAWFIIPFTDLVSDSESLTFWWTIFWQVWNIDSFLCISPDHDDYIHERKHDFRIVCVFLNTLCAEESLSITSTPFLIKLLKLIISGKFFSLVALSIAPLWCMLDINLAFLFVFGAYDKNLIFFSKPNNDVFRSSYVLSQRAFCRKLMLFQ